MIRLVACLLSLLLPVAAPAARVVHLAIPPFGNYQGAITNESSVPQTVVLKVKATGALWLPVPGTSHDPLRYLVCVPPVGPLGCKEQQTAGAYTTIAPGSTTVFWTAATKENPFTQNATSGVLMTFTATEPNGHVRATVTGVSHVDWATGPSIALFPVNGGRPF